MDVVGRGWDDGPKKGGRHEPVREDRKSTRLNSSHRCTSYAVFCLKQQTSRPVMTSGRSAVRLYRAIFAISFGPGAGEVPGGRCSDASVRCAAPKRSPNVLSR